MNAFLIIDNQVFSLSETPTLIGRRLVNHLVISDPMVSRYHARIDREEDNYVIIDLDSSGGTYVNGERITRAALNSGDSIVLAHVPVVFVQNAPHLVEKAMETTSSLERASVDDPSPTIVDSKNNWYGQI